MFDLYWEWILAGIVAAPVLGALGFARWMKKSSGATGELATKYWDVFIRLASALTVIAGGAFTYAGYVQGREDARQDGLAHERRQAEIRQAEILSSQLEFERQRHDRFRKALSEARTTAAFLATHAGTDPNRRARFDELYYSDLIGIENQRVEAAMVAFMRELVRVEKEGATVHQLNTLSLRLSREVDRQLADDERTLRDLASRIASLLPGGN
ncbi:MAG: hypothetical protein ACKVPY_10295 [Paracoccaceae bacterium]